MTSSAGKAIILELPTTSAAKTAYSQIRKSAPGISIDVFGARDLNTFRRTQRTLPPAKLTKSIDEFVQKVGSLTHA